jgi:secreted trypsin-like serine protease
MMKGVTLVLYISLVWVQAAQIRPRQNEGRIIGGELAYTGQFRFAAAIYKSTSDGTFFCGGALMGTRWIVTAGQCVDGGLLFNIRLGANALNDTNAVTVSADTYFLHPDYDPTTLSNDVGLIRLSTSVAYNEKVWPIDFMAYSPLPDNSSVVTLGWGQTSDDGTGLVNDLNYVDLITLSNDECKLAFGNQVNENMVCVKGNSNEGTCKGDLGSPLMRYDNYFGYLVGVSTFISSNGCESSDPSGFTRTYPYADWIKNVTWLS